MTSKQGSQGSAALLAAVHGAFMIGTGVWPLVSYRTFELVSGRKKEPWLVKTVGVLIAAWGLVLLRERKGDPATLARLGIPPAIALAGVDVWYAGIRRIISPVYLADAVVELALAVAWKRQRDRRR